MIDYVIYGKIIIDTIRLLNGSIVSGVLGGGGPQGAFGARVWSDSVGLLTRSGEDIEVEAVEALSNLKINLDGWVKFSDIPTPHGIMEYDENEYMQDREQYAESIKKLMTGMSKLLSQPISIPSCYQSPRAIHLITEYSSEPMVESALGLKQKGAIFSLEPLISYRDWSNRDSILELIRVADTVSPDWPSASGIAKSENPLEVVKFWSKLGPKLVTIRHGAQGSYAWDVYRDQVWHIPPVRVTAVDPTGAGNSYAGGMCVGWAEHQDAKIAGTYGAISAAFLVRSVGVPVWEDSLRTEAQSQLHRAIEAANLL